MVNKRKDPNFEQVTGLVPKDLSRRFKQFLAWKGFKISDGVTEAIEFYLEHHEPKQIAALKPIPETIAELVRQNYFALLSDGEIKPESLRAIADGENPSNAELLRIAQILDIKEEDLLAMRDRTFSKGRDS